MEKMTMIEKNATKSKWHLWEMKQWQAQKSQCSSEDRQRSTSNSHYTYLIKKISNHKITISHKSSNMPMLLIHATKSQNMTHKAHISVNLFQL